MSSAPPFESPTLEAPPEKGGCLRAGLIGCGVVALVFVLGFVGFVLYAKKNPGLFLDFAMSQYEKSYGLDVTEADRQELKAAVADFKEAIRSGKVKSDGSPSWQRSFSMRGGSSRKLSHEDVRDLIRAFREAAGEKPATAPTLVPAPALTPSP